MIKNMKVITLNKSSHFFTIGAERRDTFQNVSLELLENQYYSILGPSGCGKTTLLKCIAGIHNLEKGEISFFNGFEKSLSLMFQEDSLYEWLTVEKNLQLVLKIKNIDEVEREERVLSVLDELGLSHVKHYYPTQLSGGMKQRINLGRAIITNPKLLLLDEPLASVDYQNKIKLFELISRVVKKHGITVLHVTHDVDEALYLSNEIILMSPRPGQIIERLNVPHYSTKASERLFDPQLVTLKKEIFAKLAIL